MSVLFVCLGNIFRSFVAELCLKDYLSRKGIGMKVSSAGTEANPRLLHPATRRSLQSLGIEVGLRYPQKLTQEMISSFDTVIAMSKFHQEFIKKTFGKDAYLFNELCYGDDLSIIDTYEVELNEEEHIKRTIKHIHNAIPLLFKKLV